MADVVVLGNFVVDIIGQPIDRLPERGRLLRLDTLETHPGGCGLNTAAALGKLGAKVAALGAVGDDLYGRYVRERLHGWNVDTSALMQHPTAPTGLALVAVDSTGERSFLYHPGANGVFDPECVLLDRFPEARHFHYAGFFVLPALDPHAADMLRAARERGMTTSLDVCWDPDKRWLELLRPCLPFIDFLMPSEEEAERLSGETHPAAMARVFRNLGAGAVVIKRGERGCYYSGPEGEFHVPAFPVQVRETTGAGDCCIAGFLLAHRLRGWEPKRALRFANACGARSVSAVGAVTGLAPAEEIERELDGPAFRPVGRDG